MHKGKITFLNFKGIQKVLMKTIPQIQMFSNQIHKVKMKNEVVEAHKTEVFGPMTQTLILTHVRLGWKEGWRL